MDALVLEDLVAITTCLAGFLPPEDLLMLACASKQCSANVSSILISGLITYKYCVEKLIGVEISYIDTINETVWGKRTRTWTAGECSWDECSYCGNELLPHDWKTTYNLLLTESESLRYSIRTTDFYIADIYGVPPKRQDSTGERIYTTYRLLNAAGAGRVTSFRVLKEYLHQTEKWNTVDIDGVIRVALNRGHASILKEMEEEIPVYCEHDVGFILDIIQDIDAYEAPPPQVLDTFLSLFNQEVYGIHDGYVALVRTVGHLGGEGLLSLIQVLVKYELGVSVKPTLRENAKDYTLSDVIRRRQDEQVFASTDLYPTDQVSFYCCLETAANENRERVFLWLMSTFNFPLDHKKRRRLMATARYHNNERMQRALL